MKDVPHEDRDDEELTPHEDAQRARDALRRGELQHATFHIAGALAGEPSREEWLDLLDEIVEISEDPLKLAPVEADKPNYFGLVAVRAYIEAERGDFPGGLRRILQVLRARPDVAYDAWALAWARRPGVAREIGSDAVVTFLGGLLQAFPGTTIEDAGARATLERLHPLGEALAAAHASDADVAMGWSGLLRKIGRHDEALEQARRSYELKPTWRGAVAMALAHKARKELDAAEEWYRRAVEHDPDDVSARLDLGDLMYERGRIEDGLEWYEQVLARDPDHAWAKPSQLYGRWRLSRDPKHRAELVAYAAAHADNDRAGWLADFATPFVGRLPQPSDASVNLLAQLLRDASFNRKGGSIRLTISAMEAPSVRLAWAMALPGVKAEFAFSGMQQPDPRRTTGPEPSALWRFHDTEPEAIPGPPDAHVAHAVARIAAQPYHARDWSRFADSLGRELGAGSAEDLLATMVHPPGPPGEGWFAPTWVHRVQVAAAFVLSHIDGGWEGSQRRERLLSLLHGPMDWTVEAAAVALTEVAVAVPEARDEVKREFRKLLEALPRPGHVPHEHAIVCGLQRIGGLGEDEREELRKWQEELEA